MAFARRGIALVAPVAVLMVVISMAAPPARGQEADAPHPAHIHSGTCDNLGDIVLSAPHALNVHESAEAIQN